MPRKGWYSRTQWMATFRPDGKGHIIIAGGSDPPEDITFTEIVCDICDRDAGTDHEDGSEGRIFYDGRDSLCEECGLRAEARVRDRDREVRETLLARGWSAQQVASLSEGEVRAIAYDWAIDRAAGIPASKVAENLGWKVDEAVHFCARVLEEVNEHRLAKVLFDSLEADGQAEGGE